MSLVGSTPTGHPNKEDASCRSDNTPHEGGGIDMKHPSNRAERRHERVRITARRRAKRVNSTGRPWREQQWAQYSKWNGNCGSMQCHELKYFGHRRRRREALKQMWKDEEQIWAVGLLGVVACFASRIVRWVQFPHGPPTFTRLPS